MAPGHYCVAFTRLPDRPRGEAIVPQRDHIDTLINDVLVPLAVAVTVIGLVMLLARATGG
jgi:hypothetical protein